MLIASEGKRSLESDILYVFLSLGTQVYKYICVIIDHWFFLLNPRVRPRAGNPEVTGIPQVDYSTSRRQLTSTQAEVAYLITYPITTKPAVITN